MSSSSRPLKSFLTYQYLYSTYKPDNNPEMLGPKVRLEEIGREFRGAYPDTYGQKIDLVYSSGAHSPLGLLLPKSTQPAFILNSNSLYFVSNPLLPVSDQDRVPNLDAKRLIELWAELKLETGQEPGWSSKSLIRNELKTIHLKTSFKPKINLEAHVEIIEVLVDPQWDEYLPSTVAPAERMQLLERLLESACHVQKGKVVPYSYIFVSRVLKDKDNFELVAVGNYSQLFLHDKYPLFNHKTQLSGPVNFDSSQTQFRPSETNPETLPAEHIVEKLNLRVKAYAEGEIAKSASMTMEIDFINDALGQALMDQGRMTREKARNFRNLMGQHEQVTSEPNHETAELITNDELLIDLAAHIQALETKIRINIYDDLSQLDQEVTRIEAQMIETFADFTHQVMGEETFKKKMLDELDTPLHAALDSFATALCDNYIAKMTQTKNAMEQDWAMNDFLKTLQSIKDRYRSLNLPDPKNLGRELYSQPNQIKAWLNTNLVANPDDLKPLLATLNKVLLESEWAKFRAQKLEPGLIVPRLLGSMLKNQLIRFLKMSRLQVFRYEEQSKGPKSEDTLFQVANSPSGLTEYLERLFSQKLREQRMALAPKIVATTKEMEGKIDLLLEDYQAKLEKFSQHLKSELKAQHQTRRLSVTKHISRSKIDILLQSEIDLLKVFRENVKKSCADSDNVEKNKLATNVNTLVGQLESELENLLRVEARSEDQATKLFEQKNAVVANARAKIQAIIPAHFKLEQGPWGRTQAKFGKMSIKLALDKYLMGQSLVTQALDEVHQKANEAISPTAASIASTQSPGSEEEEKSGPAPRHH